jgi:hypothetical protein
MSNEEKEWCIDLKSITATGRCADEARANAMKAIKERTERIFIEGVYEL